MIRFLKQLNPKKVFLLVVILFTMYWIWHGLPIRAWSLQVSQFAESHGLWGVLVFSLVYILATVFLFPCAFLTFAAGMAYGFWALPLVVISACTGACLAFLISRHFVKNQIERLMNKRPQTQALRTALEEEGWKFMFLLRISPLIPFNLNNYFLGTIQVRFFTYLWVTLIGSLPGTLLYIYLGVLGKDIGGARTIKWALFAIGLLATFILARMTLKRTKEILAERASSLT